MTAIDDFTRLKHIADACQEALDFIKGITRQELENDRMLSLALVKELEIIGEATNHISSELKKSSSRCFLARYDRYEKSFSTRLFWY